MSFKDSGETQYYKIGVSDDVPARIRGIQTGNPFKIKVVSIFEIHSATKVEKLIHKSMSEFKMIGEWFEINEESRAHLESLVVPLESDRVCTSTIYRDDISMIKELITERSF